MRIAELRGLTLHLGNECTLVTRRCMDAGRGERRHTPRSNGCSTLLHQLHTSPTAAVQVRPHPPPHHAHGVYDSLLTCLLLCHVRCVSPVMSVVCPV
jgi:hypothetical protein